MLKLTSQLTEQLTQKFYSVATIGHPIAPDRQEIIFKSICIITYD